MCRGQSFCHVLSRASLLLLISLSVWLIGGSTQKHQTLAYAVDAAGRSLVSIEVAKDVSCLFPELEKECAVKLKIKRSGSRGRNRKERVDEGGTKERVEVNRQDEAKRDEKANLSKKLRRHLRRDPELYEILINNTYGVNSTGESISEPHCALHLQYVVVVRDIVSLDSSQRSELKFYVNKRDELRFYSCYPCRVCPPGIPLLLPCHGRSNTLCDDFGVKRENSDKVVDADNLDCVPLVSTDPGKTTASQPLPTTRVTSTRTGFHFHIPKLGNRDDLPVINREVEPSSSPHHKPTGTRITIITAGVVFLNVLFLFMLIITAVRCHKGLKYRIKYTKTHHCYGSINNESSAHQLGLTPSSRHQATSPLPSISNQVHVNKRQIIAGVDRNTRQVVMESSLSACNSRESYSEVPLVEVHRSKENNLNVFREPSLYEQGAQTVSAPPAEDVGSPAPIQVLRGKDPFWLVMIGRFGPEGGILSCEDSDVILEIPQGAIPAEHQEQLIIARISLCPHSIGPKIRDPNALWLTPLVEMESPGLEKFTRDVKIRLPHRARLQPGWTFIVHFTDPTADTNDVSLSDPTPTTSSQDPEATAFLRGEDANAKSKWGWVEKRWHSGKADRHSRDSSRVNFKVDEKYINISTSHFSEYVCTGCNEKHPLNLEVVVYWKHFKVEGHQQMDLNVYIIDTIKDTRKANVEKNERASKCVGAQSGMTGYFPLKLEYKSGEPSWLAIQVDKESMGADWKWRLQTFQGLHPAQRVMSVESVTRCCCSPLLSAREMFSFHPKNLDNGEFLTFFQAMVRIKNTMPEADLVTPILVTAPLSKRPTQISKNNNNMPVSIEDIITDDHVEFISGLLPYDKWRPLYRKLMGKGAKNGIDHIVESNPHDPREQIHCALSGWKMSRGREATVETLLAALGSLGLQDVADDLQLFGAEEVTSNELPATSNAGPVYVESHL